MQTSEPKTQTAQAKSFIRKLQTFAGRLWYPPFIGVLAALDNFVIVIPNDGILVSSAILTPRRWFTLALCVAIGSTLGAMVLASFVELRGLPWVLDTFSGIDQTKTWIWSAEFFEKYGLWLVFGVAISPLFQQPAVILAGLANTPLTELAVAVFVGRFIKFLIMSYVGSHAPRLLGKMWGLREELEQAGIELKR